MTYAHPEYLIEPQTLADELTDGEIKIFDATVHLVPAEKGYRAESGLADYQAGHIPGAAFLDQIRAVSDTSTGLGFSLPDRESLQAGLREAGLNDNDRVVVYSSGHMMWATRAWWVLHYAGLDRVAVLNGGYCGWTSAGLTVSDQPNSYQTGSITVKPRAGRFVGRETVLAAIDSAGVCTVNALSPDVYSGESQMSYGRKGHITGSVNVHYDELLDGGRFRPAEQLSDALAAQGLLDADQVITYCGGGISAKTYGGGAIPACY